MANNGLIKCTMCGELFIRPDKADEITCPYCMTEQKEKEKKRNGTNRTENKRQ